MRSYARSLEWLSVADKITCDAAQTMSRAPRRFPVGAHPICLVRGDGSKVWDGDGNQFTDFILSLAAVTLGHNFPAVTNAVIGAIQAFGSNVLSQAHPLEAEVAERICQIFPCGQDGMVRFCASGSEADAGAWRIARRATGRDIVWACGYAGWHDGAMVRAKEHPGIPEVLRTIVKGFEVGSYPDDWSNVAAVSVEPPLFPPEGLDVDLWLCTLKEQAHENRALFLVDEVVTGGRYALGGAQEFYGIRADMAVFGKAFANSYPLAGIVGERHLMKYADTVSGTFAGGIISLAACDATLDVYQREPVIKHMWDRGTEFCDGLKKQIEHHDLAARIDGFAVHPRLVWEESPTNANLLMSVWLQEMAEGGVLLHPGGWNCSYSHTQEDVNASLEASDAAFKMCAEALSDGKIKERLRGEQIQQGFKVR